MSDAIRQTIDILEHEVEALEQRRGELLRTIDALRPLAEPSAPVHNGASRRGRTIVRRRSVKRPPRKTDGRSKTRATRSLPDVTKHSAAIVEALRTKSPQNPSELAARVKLARPALTYHMKRLLQRGVVVATGATQNRQFSLPAGRPAKEEP